MDNWAESNGISVVMSVYKNDRAEWVDEAIESVVAQTLSPAEIVIVFDGPIKSEVSEVIYEWKRETRIPIQIVALEKNSGLGIALKAGVEAAKYDLIARMDSDDRSVGSRFEKQIEYLKMHPEVDVLGGQIREFESDTGAIVGLRKVPCSNAEIRTYMKRRCPMNHVSVIMRRKIIEEAGNYRNFPFNEDYDLWIRLAQRGAVFSNLDDSLVYVRVNDDMYYRRGGMRYFKSEYRIQRTMLESRMIGRLTYYTNILERFILQVVFPNRIRAFVYKRFARNKISE